MEKQTMGFFVAGTLVLLAFVCWATYRTAQLLREIPLDFNLLLLPAENLLRLILIAVCLALGVVSSLPFARLGWASLLVDDFLIGLAIGTVTQIVVNIATDWAIVRFGRGIYSPRVVLSVLPRSRTELVLVPLAFIPAVALEELLFRSLLLGGFSVFAPPLLLALVLSALFGAMHAPQGSLGIVVATGLGFLLSLLFLWRASLWPCLVAHYVINLLQVAKGVREREWLESFERSAIRC
jgi:membrane protease YdiL (CAAX protease family)